ncbi:MAG: L-malate glycosyltransferase [Eubacteriales bacterium]|nr:L-malate glycosyltransferase [Eubacteriales bacterium]MDN5364277.1 L-malate glycosyltransferase [Eubacteriales bacterium]
MKIGIVCYPSYGGSGVVATELGLQLARRGHEVHFISYERPVRLQSFEPGIFFHEVDICQYPLFKYPPYSLALAGKIAEVARAAELDLVHVHYAIPHAASAYLARQMLRGRYLPIITTLHGTDITIVGNDCQFYELVRFCLQVSDAVTAVSHSLAAETRTVFAFPGEIRVIPNFIDPQEYRPVDSSWLRERVAAPEEKVIIHISNFRPVKRIEDVVRVFASLREQIPCRLLMVGDGPDRSRAAELAARLGVETFVTFLGHQDRLVELLSASDLMLLLSEKESFGLVALEAMACGVPVVASRTGGLPEVVAQGETGFLHPVGDIEGFTRSALDLLTNPELHSRMAEAARRRAVEQFAAETVVAEYVRLYAEVIEAKVK